MDLRVWGMVNKMYQAKLGVELTSSFVLLVLRKQRVRLDRVR